MTAMENCLVAAVQKGPEAQKKAEDFFQDLGLAQKEWNKKPAKLSGGQCQRVAIARAMINDPKVIFADEPTASLDHENAFNVMKILKKYSDDRLVLVVTHEKELVDRFSKRVIAIDGGRIISDGMDGYYDYEA